MTVSLSDYADAWLYDLLNISEFLHHV